MKIPVLSRFRDRPPALEKDELLAKAIEVARDPRKMGDLPREHRQLVEPITKALQVGSGYQKRPRSVAQMANPKPVSAAVLAARAHQTLGPSSSVTPVDIALAMQSAGMDWVEPFAPGEPLQPYYGYGRQPRKMNYKIGYNVSTETRQDRIPFATLERLWDGYDIARTCTRYSINDVRSMRVRFEPIEGVEKNPSSAIAEGKKRLRRPDGKKFLSQWLAENQLNLWKFDSAPIARVKDRAGRIKRLVNVSAKTMAPMLDYFGEIPTEAAPGQTQLPPAFQQFIEGIPWDTLTWDDIIYEPFWPETDSPYGTPPLETVLINANTDVRLQLYFLQFFTAGSVPEAFAIAPEEMTSGDDIADFEEQYYDYFHGDQSERWGLHWLPHGTELEFYKPQMFDPDLAEYVERRTVAAFGLTPQNLGILADVNRATSDTQMDQQFRISTLPIVGYYEDLLDAYLQDDLDLPIQIRFDTGREKEDRLMEAQAHQIYWSMGAEKSTEVREKILGLPTDPNQQAPLGIMDNRLGWIPMEHIIAVSGDVDQQTGMPKPGTVKPVPFMLPGAGVPVPAAGGAAQGPGMGGQQSAGGARPKARQGRGDPTKTYPRPLALQRGASKEQLGAPNSAEPQSHPDGLVSGRADGEPGYGVFPGGSTAQGTGVVTAGFTTATGIAGVDPIEDDEEREDLRRWQRNARKAVSRGATPRCFEDTAIHPAVVESVWARLEHSTTRAEVDLVFKQAGPIAAGVVVQAQDTGRVLLVQRTPDKHDPKEAYARWEFPGGHIDPGETTWEGGYREWCEETGAQLHVFDHLGAWTSPDGVYRGYVVSVPSESHVQLNPEPHEVSDAKWWAKEDLDDPKVRDKVTETLDQVVPLLKGWSDMASWVDVDYRKAVDDRDCHSCRFMCDDGTCDLVIGPGPGGIVFPEDVCDLYEAPLSKAVWEDFHHHTDAIIDHFTPLVAQAMADTLPPEAITHAIRVAFGSVAKAGGADKVRAHAKAVGALVVHLLKRALRHRKLRDAVTSIYTEGTAQGIAEASHALGQPPPPPWTPGQATHLLDNPPPTLAELLRQRDMWIRGMTETEVNRIGDAVKDAIANGRPLSDVEAVVDAIVHDEARARLIAETEYARALTVAARETYRRHGIALVKWLAQPDACPQCKENEDVSPRSLGDPWPNGDVPVHPHCRCAEAPYVGRPA